MKYAAILLSLLFAMTAPPLSGTPAEEAPAPELMDIAGTVTAADEDSLTIVTETHGEVLVHLTEDTLYEGETPAVGAYVHVLNTGTMTMSLPPQITAVRVGCYAFAGTVTEIGETFFMLQTESDLYQVNAEAEKIAELAEGASVTVYSNGMMTMSIPAQIYGEAVVPAEEAPELVDIAGTVTAADEDSLTIATETHGEVLVHLTEDTLYEGETPAVGAYVHVLNTGAMTRSLPPQITALRVGCYAFTGTVTEIGETFFMLQTESGLYQVNAEAEKIAGLAEGASVTVYSNGMMTMSIPAQIYGEVVVPAE